MNVSATDPAGVFRELLRGPSSAERLAGCLNLPAHGVEASLARLSRDGLAESDAAGWRVPAGIDPLDAGELMAGLSASARAAIGHLEVLWEAGSTNTVLMQAPLPPHGSQVLLAECQSAGRGRRGRAWVAAPLAGLAMSLSRRFRTPVAALAPVALVSGLAVAEALGRRLGLRCALKWPNDVLVQGRKLAGILVEARTGGAVIGIGLNVHAAAAAHAQEESIGQPWITLDEATGRRESRNRVTAAVLEQLLPMLEAFDHDGWAGFQSRYAAVDSLRGQRLRFSSGSGAPVEGIGQGVSDTGGYRVLDLDGRVRHLHGGEITVRAT